MILESILKLFSTAPLRYLYDISIAHDSSHNVLYPPTKIVYCCCLFCDPRLVFKKASTCVNITYDIHLTHPTVPVYNEQRRENFERDYDEK